MKKCSKCGMEKPLDCFSKRKRSKDGLNVWCKDCFREYRQDNKEKFKEYNDAWKAKNPEKALEVSRRASRNWGRRNPDKVKQRNQQFKKNHPDKVKAAKQRWNRDNPEKVKEHNRRTYQRNPARYKAAEANRRAALLQATPEWADLRAIEAFYANCPSGYEVDHYFPLQGKEGTGLHVVENLRYITRSENRKKGNKWPSSPK